MKECDILGVKSRPPTFKDLLPWGWGSYCPDVVLPSGFVNCVYFLQANKSVRFNGHFPHEPGLAGVR